MQVRSELNYAITREMVVLHRLLALLQLPGKNFELYPIIRPRGGDFLYSDDEFEVMKNDVQFCKGAGCDGIVTGILHQDGTVDKDRCRQLVTLAYPLGATFHRAFDRCNDPFKAIEDIIECGFERILTSGQQPAALEGIALIASLIEKAANRIVVMPGSGVRSDNIATIAKQTRASEFHTSARTMADGKMKFNNAGMKEQLKSISVDGKEIKKIAAILAAL